MKVVLRDIDEAALVLACELFVSGAKTDTIRQAVNEELTRLNCHYTVTREQVYQLLAFGQERRYFTFTPPERLALQTRVANAFELPQSCVHVANSSAIDQVAATAAALVVDLILKLGEKHPVVHIGLGGGYTSRLVTYHLATQLRAIRTVDDLPKLVLHALSTGFDPECPHTAPVTFFGFFEGIASPIEYFGLFASPVVKTAQYADTLVELEACYRAAREDLHLVITSLGSASHTHGDFMHFMKEGTAGPKSKKSKKGEDRLKFLKERGWVGDILFRPYSAKGSITEDTDIRAVTLLELDELREMASSKDKHVVVVAGPCSICAKTRGDAVLPLFEEPKLRLWSHFVMDMGTAEYLIEAH